MHIILLKLSITLFVIAFSTAASSQDKIPYTSFQTPTGYLAENDLKTGAVIVYATEADRIKSWQDKGYTVQTMYGFRTYQHYVDQHPDECQTAADGTKLTCGPGSYYMVPTANRTKIAVDYMIQAIRNGTSAIVPEEPEFFVRAGYSESFKRAWQEHYKERWQDPASSIEARYKSERLKAKMSNDIVKAIFDAAEAENPKVRRMIAFHSPVNYFSWAISFAHYDCIMNPSLQEIIGQVWTGTARTPCQYEGTVAERTFETAFLEYSSLYNLARGTGKRLWFLMDPLEDNLERSMEDYHTNYHLTLTASLMFPEVDAYEVLPWPTRIYGRVPWTYANEISIIISALDDMHNHKKAIFDTGTHGIATFVADSMGWQRGEPYMSDFDCFFGLTLPLLYKGIPVQVAQLERTIEPDYLKQYKVLLVSYDILKPMKPEYNQALADWVKKGGVLVFVGGKDAYNALPEWWTKKGFASPGEDLFSRLGANGKLRPVSIKGFAGLAALEKKVGDGALIHVSTAPSHFVSSAEAADALRSLTRYACGLAGLGYKEQGHLAIRRGKYVSVRTFDGVKQLKGTYVNLLKHTLPVAKDPVVKPWATALYCDVTGDLSGAPKLLYTSAKVEEKSENDSMIRLKLSGPAKTKGTARIYTAGRPIVNVLPAGVKVEGSGETRLLTFDNKPEGVEIAVEF